MLVGQRPSNLASLLEVDDRDVFVMTFAEILDNGRIVGDVMAVKAHVSASRELTANTVRSASGRWHRRTIHQVLVARNSRRTTRPQSPRGLVRSG